MIKSPEKMFYCKLQDKDNNKFWGFLSPSDERLETALESIEVTIEKQQELISGGYIVYYGGELYNAPADEYYLDENADFQKRNPEEVEHEKEEKRRKDFEKDFFHTSLGYIRRNVSMATGETKDFLSDLLPTITMGIQTGSTVHIIAYSQPDFTQEITDWTQYQSIVTVTPQFIQECFAQLQNDFKPSL